MTPDHTFYICDIERCSNGYIVSWDFYGEIESAVFHTFAEATSYIASAMCRDDNNGAEG